MTKIKIEPHYFFTPILLLALILGIPFQGSTQEPIDNERRRAFELFEHNKFTEAIPLLEKLVAKNPDDVVVLERLGWSTFVVSASVKDSDQRKKMRARARQLLERSTELGGGSELSRAGLDALSGPDPAEVKYSDVAEANDAMKEGEASHSRGELDKAVESYKRALQLDPKLYLAALLTGDMYFKMGYQARDLTTKKEKMSLAGEWFARATAIDENVETAYRYWGDALMALDEKDAAKVKFIEAIIAEPYERRPYVGLTQWAGKFKVRLAHPKIEQPSPTVSSSPREGGGTIVTMDPKSLDPAKGTAYYWSFYDLVRSTYKIGSFAKDHPDEKEYRHSIKEEALALGIVASTASKARASGKLTTVDDSLENVMKLHEAGLIEAYVFFVRPNAGIARDYVSYRKANRDKLRRYWVEFVVKPSPAPH